MESLVDKFLPRIADCVLDVDMQVQEKAATLLLILLKEGFLDDWENENGWNQINLRAITPDTSLSVRKYALYFVLDQLDAFDEDDDNNNNNPVIGTSSSNKSKEETSPEMRQVEKLDALASW